jgi:hypothetical protein
MSKASATFNAFFLSFHHHLLHQQPKVSSNNPMASPITQHVPTLEATIFASQGSIT